MLPSRLSKLIAGCAAPALLVATIIAPACVVDEDFVNGDELFQCTSNDDCLSGYECNVTTNLCKKKVPGEKPVCVDMDKDGYGVGAERIECRFPQEDFDDTDSSRYPGAPEICDGKDNDGDEQIDGTISCNGPADCPQQGVPNGALTRCTAGTCRVTPSNTTIEGCNIELKCNGADGYDPLPEQCQ